MRYAFHAIAKNHLIYLTGRVFISYKIFVNCALLLVQQTFLNMLFSGIYHENSPVHLFYLS